MDYLNRYRGVTRETQLLLATTFLSSIPLGIIYVIQPLYLKSLGYPPPSIGLLLGIASISSTVFMIPGGIMADYFGQKKMLIVSIIAYVIYLAIFGVSSDFCLLSLASFLSGFSWGTYAAPFTALLAKNAGPDKGSYVFSFHSSLFTGSIIIGNLSVGLVDVLGEFFQMIPFTSYKILFLMGAILSFISIIPPLKLTEKASSKKVNHVLKLKSWKNVKKFATVNFLNGFGAGLFIPFLPLYMKLRYSASDALIGTALATSNAVIAIAFLASPSLVERIGNVKTIVVTQGLSIIPLLMTPLPLEFNIFILLYSIRAVLMNMASPIFTAYMMSNVEESERASVSGITATTWTGGSAASSIIAGYVMGVSLDLPVYLCSIFYLLATALFYLFFREQDLKT